MSMFTIFQWSGIIAVAFFIAAFIVAYRINDTHGDKFLRLQSMGRVFMYSAVVAAANAFITFCVAVSVGR